MACNMYPAFAQEEEITDTTRYPPVGSKEYYLNKSRNQTKGGRTFLIVGTALMVAGIIEGSSGSANNENFGYGSSFDAGASLLVVGILVDLASIPFFTSASKNARMAAAAGETSGEYKKDLKNKQGRPKTKKEPGYR